MPILPAGLRTFACYVQAHAAYLAGDSGPQPWHRPDGPAHAG